MRDLGRAVAEGETPLAEVESWQVVSIREDEPPRA